MLIEDYTEVEKIDEVITEIFSHLAGINPEDEQYGKMIDQVTKLVKIKETIALLKIKAFDSEVKRCEIEANHSLKKQELISNHDSKAAELALKQKESDKPDRISKDTLAIIGANLLGIGMVLGYERINVIASKAFGLVMKSR